MAIPWMALAALVIPSIVVPERTVTVSDPVDLHVGSNVTTWTGTGVRGHKWACGFVAVGSKKILAYGYAKPDPADSAHSSRLGTSTCTATLIGEAPSKARVFVANMDRLESIEVSGELQ